RHRERRSQDADRERPGLDAAELTPQAMHPQTLSDPGAEVQACAPVRFSGKRAVVSGAANGIGRAVAERLTAEGAEVAGLDVDPGATFQLDVRDEAAVADAFAKFGPVDVVVPNAGVQLTDEDAPVDRLELSIWRETL